MVTEHCPTTYACVHFAELRPEIARLEGEKKELLEALKKIEHLGNNGAPPDYTSWLTFHERIAAIARAAFGQCKVDMP